MKKFLCIFTAIVLVFILGTSITWGEVQSKTEQVSICERNIKLLANALELYANDHYMDYPESKEFYSKDFEPYIAKALGKTPENPGQFYNCPVSGRIQYSRSKTQRTYTLSCPSPEKLGLKALYFSSKDGFVKDEGKEKIAVPAKSPEPVMSDADKQEINAVIKELYEAYENKDLEKVMEIEHEAIMRSARDMVKRRPDIENELEVYYAFKGTANDVFRAAGFGMEPLNLSDVRYKIEEDQFIVFSYVPIISTKQVEVPIGNVMKKVRLRIASFNFEKIDGKMTIVKMQLY